MKKNLFLFFSLISIGSFLFLLFYLFSIQVKHERFKSLNFDTTVRIQHIIPDRLAELFEDSSIIISPLLSLFWLTCLTFLLLLQLSSKKIFIGALLVPLFFSFMIGAEIIGKSRVESPAPPFFMLKNPVTVFPKYHIQELYSYPSGHASRVLFFAGLLILLLWREKNRLIFILGVFLLTALVVFVSIGKVYLGHHWITDIIGGWIISLGCLCYSYAFLLWNFSIKKNKRSLQ